MRPVKDWPTGLQCCLYIVIMRCGFTNVKPQPLFYKCKTAFAGFHQRNQPTVDHFTGIISDTYSMEKVVFTSCIWKNEWKKHRVVGLLLKVNTHQFLHWASVPKLCLCFYYICCKPSETSHSAPEQTSEKQKQRQDCAGNVLVQIGR